MAQTQKWDKLNNLQTKAESKPRSIPFEQYFGEMDLSEEEKERRIALAEHLETVFRNLFTLVTAIALVGDEEYADILGGIAVTNYIEALNSLGLDVDGEESYLSDYVTDTVALIVSTTNENKDDEYYTSDDRATLIAENESNTVFNNVALNQAIKKGYKYKTWNTMHDRKVRKTHLWVDGETIGIYDDFMVGDSAMAFPKDQRGDAKECVGCRCVLKFKK